MLKPVCLLAIATLCAALSFAQSPTIRIQAPRTRADDGHQMYVNYCAPCHGLDGRGHGPTAAVLKVPPADLTVLSTSNNGKYPDVHVAAVLQFGIDTRAHGSKEMPVWGPVLRSVEPRDDQIRALRITNLVRYVETLQAK